MDLLTLAVALLFIALLVCLLDPPPGRCHGITFFAQNALYALILFSIAVAITYVLSK